MQQLWQYMFSTPEMDALFSAESFLKCMLRFERSLAESQAMAGIIPRDAARVIAEIALENDWDMELLTLQTTLAGNPAIPFVRTLTQKIQSKNKEAARYVHLGATSQDVIDTALMLQLKTAMSILLDDAIQLQYLMAELTEKHASSVMMGRTLLQQARPITFGFKIAVWLDSLNYSIEKIRELNLKTLALQLGGACGTLPGFCTQTETILSTMADKLQLSIPAISWHTQRYRIVDIANTLAILCGSIGKMAKDIILLMQTEVAEAFEGAVEGKGGSSAMPHKRNPVSSTYLVAIAGKAAVLSGAVTAGMLHEQERAAGNWHEEWNILPELTKLSAAALHHAIDLLSHLEVDTKRMRENIEMTKGLVFAEDVAALFTQKTGKKEAQKLIQMACKDVVAANTSLKEYLLINHHITRDEADHLFSPENAIGQSGLFIKRVLQQIQ